MRLLTDQISLKKYFMLILSVTFLVPSHYSFPRLQLHVTRKYEIIFVPLCFYLRQKKGSKSVSQLRFLKFCFTNWKWQYFCPSWCHLLCQTFVNKKQFFQRKKNTHSGVTFVLKLSQKCALNSKIHTHRRIEI